MTSNTPREKSHQPFLGFDLRNIFIGREQQLDLFRYYLESWQESIKKASLNAYTKATAAPSPDNQILGLVVLLYGRGGFGKSTLLKRYREVVLIERPQQITVSKIIDWEFAAEGKRALFSPISKPETNSIEYFSLVRGQLAIALDKRTNEFKEYQKAVEAVEDARKQANRVLDDMQKNERYTSLQWLASEGTIQLIRWIAPRVGNVLDNKVVAEKVKELVGKGVEISADQLMQLYANLRDKLGNKLSDYLEPVLKLGNSLGSDLHQLQGIIHYSFSSIPMKK